MRLKIVVVVLLIAAIPGLFWGVHLLIEAYRPAWQITLSEPACAGLAQSGVAVTLLPNNVCQIGPGWSDFVGRNNTEIQLNASGEKRRVLVRSRDLISAVQVEAQ